MKSEDIASAIYNGDIYMRGIVWCAFVMRNWAAVGGEIVLFEKAVGEWVKARDAGRAHGPIAIDSHELEIISSIRHMLSSHPDTAEDWAKIEAAARLCVAKMALTDLLPLPPEGDDASAGSVDNVPNHEAPEQ